MRFTLLVLGSLLFAAPAAFAEPPVVTQADCATTGTPERFLAWDAALENLAFDDAGRMWVSDLGGDRLLDVAADGTVSRSVTVPGMHGVLVDGATVLVGASGDGAEVWRFAADDLTTHDVVATGFHAANGLTFDGAGALYVSSPLSASAPYLAKVDVATGAWTEFVPELYGANGLWFVADENAIYAAITAEQTSDVVRIRLTDPPQVETVAQLAFGAASLQPNVRAPNDPSGRALMFKGLDDLTMGPDGQLYAAAHLTNEVLRIDPATGAACVFANGFFEPTSVRFAPASFGAFAGDLFVTDMGGVGVTGFTAGGFGSVWRVPMAG